MATGDYIQRPKMDPLPLPDDSGEKQAEATGFTKTQAALQQPPGAGFASKGGQLAYVANNILTGWMAGRHVKEQKLLDKAKGDVTSSRSVYDQLADVYRNNIAAGKDKNSDEMKKLSADISASWTNYVNVADKYTMSDDEKDGKKPKKNKVEKMFGMDIDPQMFRKGSIEILRKSGAPVLQEEESTQSKAARAQLDAANQEIQQRKDDIQRDKRWRELATLDPSKRTKEQQEELDGIERTKFPKTAEQEARDGIIKKVTGGQKLSDGDRELGESLGVLRHNQPSMLQHKDAENNDWVVVLDEKGNELGRRNLGKGYVPPDQVDINKRLMQQQHDAMVADYKRAFGGPGVDPVKLEQDAQRFALYSASGFKGYGRTPAEAEGNQFLVSDAIKTVRGELSKDDKVILDNFIVAPMDDPNGLYYWRTSMVDPQGESGMWWWKKPSYFGGIGQKELPGYERQMIDRLRTALKKRHKDLTDEQINQLIPQSSLKGSGMSAMPQGPAQPGMTPVPPKPGMVKMRAPNGQEQDVSQEDVPYYKSKGAKEVPAEK